MRQALDKLILVLDKLNTYHGNSRWLIHNMQIAIRYIQKGNYETAVCWLDKCLSSHQ